MSKRKEHWLEYFGKSYCHRTHGVFARKQKEITCLNCMKRMMKRRHNATILVNMMVIKTDGAFKRPMIEQMVADARKRGNLWKAKV